MSAREIKHLADRIVKNEKKQAQAHHRDTMDLARITKIIVMRCLPPHLGPLVLE
jgi:hypothetical protein